MNEEIKQQLNIKEDVLKKIESGEVKMTSRFYFMLKLILLVLTTVFITLISIFLLSFAIFNSSLDGSMFLVRFGGRGLYNFILTLPWYLLLIDILLLILLDYILKSFRFGYKSPIIYLFIGTFFIITAISTLINLTSFHYKVMSNVGHFNIPVIPRIYSSIGSQIQKPGTWKGYVSNIEENEFTFSFINGVTGEKGVAIVVAMPNVDVDKYLNQGDLVFVAGTLNNGEIKAYGIKKLNE